jgi:transcription elongation GreA/GreB family factor
MDKNAILAQLLEMLSQEVTDITRSLNYHREAAIEAEGRMVSRYDSTKAEMSYLADGHQGRLLETNRLISALRNFNLVPKDKIEIGALVQMQAGEEVRFYFILPGGAAREVEIGGRKIMIISPQAPLGKAMKGLESGDTVLINKTEFEIIQIW